METVASVLTSLVAEAARTAGYGDAPVPLIPCVATQDPRHGDYQCNFAFQLGKAIRTNPRAVAQQIADALPAHDAIAGVEVAGPGFLNFRVTDAWLGARLVQMASHPNFGTPQVGAGKTIVIDYSSPNVAKRMHVGHLRSTLIGHAIVRLYQVLGWRVIGDNHIGDWGTQFGKLIVGLGSWEAESPVQDDPIGHLQWLYQQFDVRAKADPALADRAREETAKLQAGDPANKAVWQHIVDVSLAENDVIYRRLGIQFDATLGESFYNDRLGPLVASLLSGGIAEESEGAVVIRFAEQDGKGLSDQPLLVRKKDGAALYGTTDLATVAYRTETWHPDRIVYVTDVRQQLHFRQVFAASRKMGHQPELVHVGFGMLKLADGAVASTRAGQVINLVDLLDTAAARAFEVVTEKSPHLAEGERRTIAEAVGLGAVRYTDLSQNPQSDILFDWGRMLSFDGNTAPYLMYAHARCCSILARADSFSPGALCPEHDTEKALARLLARLPEVLISAAEGYRPNQLADHLFQIAQALARFYKECRVLQAETDALRQSRLTLVHTTTRALATGLRVLGIEPLERM